jgi:hypothetical protein
MAAHGRRCSYPLDGGHYVAHCERDRKLAAIPWLFSLALEYLQRLRGGEIEIVYPDASFQRRGWDLLISRGGSGAKAVDCTSFALMQERKIRLAYTFDDHFRQAGFQTLLP